MANNEQNKNTMYIIAAVIVIVIIALAVWQPWAKKEPVVNEPVVQEPEEPTLPEPEVPTDYEGDALVSDAICVGGKIAATITNTGTANAVIGKDMTVSVNSLVVKNPGCEVSELEPGQSTRCSNMNGNFKVRTGKNEVLVRTSAEQGQATVTCS